MCCSKKRDSKPVSYEDFHAEVRRRKRLYWADILAAESPERAIGRRPRDPEKEALLLRLDKARLVRERG